MREGKEAEDVLRKGRGKEMLVLAGRSRSYRQRGRLEENIIEVDTPSEVAGIVLLNERKRSRTEMNTWGRGRGVKELRQRRTVERDGAAGEGT